MAGEGVGGGSVEGARPQVEQGRGWHVGISISMLSVIDNLTVSLT